MLLFLAGCGEAPPTAPPQYAFYHWETRLDPHPGRVAEYGADRLYIKVFDVSWTDGRAEPSALLEVTDSLKMAAVPVVFITNEVFTHSGPDLAARIAGLIEQRFPFPFGEVQIDCDWTAGTREAYFAFLRRLGELLPDKQVSCTVRLHQYRDRDAQGIPPVDRAVLMAYNTGDLGSWETENSIVDTVVIGRYTAGQPPYPLPLDLAVAVYDWAAVYRQGALAYLINEPDLTELADSSRFAALAPLRYRVDRSTYFAGLYLYRNDLIRREVADRRGALRLAASLWPQIANRGSERVIFYRIGSRQWRD
ncbi:hypothetical protein GGR28_002889 [Lewinella aquimaris]|uniref:Uncharacterized protein n=1 Tax=Neolewinella aquimaris TaxID=1835722 RepID=A0A840EEN0_9BACT|nr:hypothetical protein [Neolewinella aquimaris]MBB4080259.1 hypothetical protein [Neolewinella aquimaris]